MIPGFGGEVEDDDVEGGAEVDGVADGALVLMPVSALALFHSFILFPLSPRAQVTAESWDPRTGLQHTFATHEGGVLREFLVQLFQRRFHRHQSPVCD